MSYAYYNQSIDHISAVSFTPNFGNDVDNSWGSSSLFAGSWKMLQTIESN